MKNRFLVLLLAVMMLAAPASAFAGAEPGPSDEAAPSVSAEQKAQPEKQEDKAAADEGKAADEAENKSDGKDAEKKPAEEAKEEAKAPEKRSKEWLAEDFTYAEVNVADVAYPASEMGKKLSGDAALKWVVSGFSDSGTEKLAGGNTELVIPAADPDGRKVQGVGAAAFQNKGLTKLSVPKTAKAANSAGWTTGSGQIGDFYILANAFSGNELSDLTLPEGVIAVQNSAFASNKIKSVRFPRTLMMIWTQAFAKNGLESAAFPARTNYALNIDNMAFAVNKITELNVPENMEKCTKWAFFQNTGMEPVTNGTAQEKKGGIVYMHIMRTDDPHPYIDDVTNKKSNVQKLVYADTWTADMFTYDAEGTTVTGLTDDGKELLKTNPDMVMPDKNPEGKYITAIGPGAGTGKGTFYFEESGNGTSPADRYAPTSVRFPSRLKTIGNFAFSSTSTKLGGQIGPDKIDFPETLESIGDIAFQNCPLTEVEFPDSVTSIGRGSFAGAMGNETMLESVKFGSGIKDITDSAFSTQNITSVEIPEGVETIGRNAFVGNFSTSVSIPNTVKSIGRDAFKNHQLVSLEIPKSVEKIDQGAFANIVEQEGKTRTLAALKLNEGLKEIGSKAFQGSLLKNVDLPTTVIKLNKDAFKDNDNGSAGDKRVVLRSTIAAQAGGADPYTGVVANGTGHRVVCAYKVTFNANGGTVDPAYAYTDEAGRLSSYPTPETEASCKVFGGWYTAEEDGEEVSEDTVYTEDTEIYAVWSEQHELVKTEAKEATCTEDGNREYYTCSKCGKIFEDADGKIETTADAVVIKALEHEMVKVEAKEATCTEDGNKEHYKCSRCGKLYEDADGKTETTAGDVIIKAKGHNWDSGVVTKKPTETSEGIMTYTCQNDPSHTRTEVIPKLVIKPAVPDLYRTQSIKSKSAIELMWKKAENAMSYRIAYRKAGGKWKFVNAGGTSKIVKGHVAGGLYEYKVASVRKVGTKQITSKYSNPKYRYYDTVSGAEAKAVKGGVKVTWNDAPAATAYQVFYKVKGDKKYTVVDINGKKKTSCTVKAKKGQTVYVRVRPVKADGGKKYIGIFSSEKVVMAR